MEALPYVGSWCPIPSSLFPTPFFAFGGVMKTHCHSHGLCLLASQVPTMVMLLFIFLCSFFQVWKVVATIVLVFSSHAINIFFCIDNLLSCLGYS
jgi:hypothetical protein